MYFCLVIENIQIKLPNVIIDKEIWRNMSNHETYKFLIKSNLTKQERTECDRLDELMEKIILNKYKNPTHTFTIAKTESGYFLKRNCKLFRKEGCKTQWSLDINGSTGEASFECLRYCQHSFTAINIKRK